jgi:hypothetical protein
MSSIETLIDEFPGDAAWAKFVSVFKASWDGFKGKEKFADEIGHEEIAVALHAKMGTAAINWMQQPIGALDKKSVRQVLADCSSGETAIKSLIMRMPV